MKHPEETARDQPRLGMEGKGGTTKPGDILTRSGFRKYFVGGMAALGLVWFLTSVKPFSSKLEPVTSKVSDISRGGSKPPTVPSGKAPEGPTLKTGPKVPNPHSGLAAGQSEGESP